MNPYILGMLEGTLSLGETDILPVRQTCFLVGADKLFPVELKGAYMYH